MVEEKTLFFFCLCFCHLAGVFGDELKSVMEGDSVTLQTNVTEKQTDEKITWRFGTDRSVIAKIDRMESVFYDVRFRDRLKLDEKTGSLTITNIRAEHAGVYEVQISSKRSETTHRFTVTVYDPSSSYFLIMLISAAAGFLFLVVSVGIFCIYRKQRKTNQQVETGEEITYADPTFYKRQNGQNTQKSEDDVIYAGVVTRR